MPFHYVNVCCAFILSRQGSSGLPRIKITNYIVTKYGLNIVTSNTLTYVHTYMQRKNDIPIALCIWYRKGNRTYDMNHYCSMGLKRELSDKGHLLLLQRSWVHFQTDTSVMATVYSFTPKNPQVCLAASWSEKLTSHSQFTCLKTGEDLIFALTKRFQS